MEIIKKCSNKKHSELNAISYCLEYNLYLCNKCSNYHKEYTDTHHINDLLYFFDLFSLSLYFLLSIFV